VWALVGNRLRFSKRRWAALSAVLGRVSVHAVVNHGKMLD
jgi:hypothetical protein